MVSRKIDDIQILRGLAITMVLSHHFSFSATVLAALPFHLTNSFYAGVELFFVISGFVVTRSLTRGSYRPGAFLIRRGFRLYPPIIVFLAVSAAINAIIRAVGTPQYAVDTFCLPLADFVNQGAAILGGYLINLGTGVGYMNGAMWSLSVEFQFYAAVAILALIAIAVRASPRVTGGALLGAAIAVYAACAYSRILLTFGMQPDFGMYLLAWRFDFMALGVVLAFIPDSVFHHIPRYGRFLSIVLAAAPMIVLSFCRAPLSPQPAGPNYLDGLGMLVVGLCYVALVGLAVGGHVSAALPRGLGRMLFLVGERSYTVYLLHFPCMVVAWVMIVATRMHLTGNAWVYAITQPVVTLAVLVPLTEIVYGRIELPAIEQGQSVLGALRRWRAPV